MPITLVQIIFLYFAVAIVALSLLTITRRNPVYSVLYLLLMFFHVAGLYVMLNAEFLAAIQIIVYAGAILVLYLFVLMLLNVPKEELGFRGHRHWPLFAIFGVGVGLEFLALAALAAYRAPMGPYSIDAVKSVGNAKVVGLVLYTEYLFPFEVASVVLLVAMVGAILLTKRRFFQEESGPGREG